MGKRVILVTGGQRSGKSRYAQQLALSLSAHPVYLATARIWDEEFRRRVERHQHDRGGSWSAGCRSFRGLVSSTKDRVKKGFVLFSKTHDSQCLKIAESCVFAYFSKTFGSDKEKFVCKFLPL